MAKKLVKVRPRRPTDATPDTAVVADTSLGLLRLLHRSSQKLESIYMLHAGPNGLTACQSAILGEVAADPKLSQTDICERTGIDRSTVAEVMRRLESVGYVQRHRVASDARRYALTITEKGSSALAASSAAMSAAEKNLTEKVSVSVLLVITHLLGRLIDKPIPRSR